MYSGLILIPLLAVFILNVPLRAVMRKSAFWLAALLFAGQAAVVFLPQRAWLLKTFFGFNLRVDNLSLVMLFCIGMVEFITLLVARLTITDEGKIFDFINILLLLASGMNGVVIVTDIFSLYVYLEVTAVASFILIAFHKNIEALEGVFKYIILSAFATVLMLCSIALLLLVSGHTDFSAINAAIKNSSQTALILFAVGLFMCGLFIKGGLMPFHGWLPDAYSEAPASVSVLLAGIVTKTVGIYTLIRIVGSVFGFQHSIHNILLLVGAISAVAGALAALGQSDFKRMLAYSSISQVGYIIIGLGCATPLGIAGAIFHFFNHAVFKSLLFVNSAAVELQTGTRDMKRMAGLAARMPVTGVTSVIASLSAAGIPPLSGFWSKLIIIIALWSAGYYLYAFIAVLASVITLAYFLSLQRMAFFGTLSEDFRNIKEAAGILVFCSVLLAIIIVGVGIFFPYVLNVFIVPAAGITGG